MGADLGYGCVKGMCEGDEVVGYTRWWGRRAFLMISIAELGHSCMQVGKKQQRLVYSVVFGVLTAFFGFELSSSGSPRIILELMDETVQMSHRKGLRWLG